LLIDTLKVIQFVDFECDLAKAMSAGGVKAPPRQPEKSPQELKAQEGIE
jgi:hypothetical protein